MDLELDLSSENMASFLELEQEIKEIPLYPKPSCGIEYSLPEDCNVSSPSSIHSDVQLEQSSPVSTSLVTPDGQNVIIIIAPSSP